MLVEASMQLWLCGPTRQLQALLTRLTTVCVPQSARYVGNAVVAVVVPARNVE